MRKLALVSDTVEAELSGLNMPLRQDARLFLIVNLSAFWSLRPTRLLEDTLTALHCINEKSD